MHFSLVPAFGILVCAASDITDNHIGFWIPVLANEAFLFSLAAYKGLYLYGEHRTTGVFTSHVTLFLVRGSTVYFLV